MTLPSTTALTPPSAPAPHSQTPQTRRAAHRALCLALTLVSAQFLCPQVVSAKTPAPTRASSLPSLPPGITLPVTLNHALHAGRTTVGSTIAARTTQRVLLPDNRYLKTGTTLVGTVVASADQPSGLSLRFTALRLDGHLVPLSVRTLAVAGFPSLSGLAVPSTGASDRGNSSRANWTTTQVGGDQVVRTQWTGPLINTRTQTVGFADFHGVYANPATPGGTPRALGPFSAGSTGLFGYSPDCTLSPAAPPASTTIQCATSTLTIEGGDALLLETLPQP